tara:strand:+ start:169 stop:408 length:240 start_codon:yes stop_codon:yes gene_type:complete
MTHPLTDDFCHRIAESWPPDAAEKDNMRSAADWQLEQAAEWLENCNMDHSLSFDGEYRSDRYLVVNAFREAMRPTQEDN